MTLPLRPLVIAALLLLTGCVGTSEPEPVPARPVFERSFDAALGAATDIGVEVRSADRANGRITGVRGDVQVTIDVLRQADGTVRLAFDAPGSTETNPKLSERWFSSYSRRMGR